MVRKIDSGKLPELYATDQLLRERKSDHAFSGFQEGTYSFRPTLKVVRRVPDVQYEVSRSPACGDGILWRGVSGFRLRQTYFSSAEAGNTRSARVLCVVVCVCVCVCVC